MSVGFIVCPGCQGLLLPDTAQCPTCNHVLDETRSGQSGQLEVRHGDDQEVACQRCNEMVRVGLVRCWRCGGFMRDEIAEQYERMKSGPQPVIYSPLPEEADPSAPPVETPKQTQEATPFVEGEDDFELGDDDDFDVADPAAVSPPPPAAPATPPAASAPTPAATPDAGEPAESTYSLSAPAEPEPAPAAPAAASPAAPEPEPAEPEHEEIQELEPAAGSDTAEFQAAAAATPAGTGKTAEDELLDQAMQEEIESRQRRKQRRVEAGAIIVYCPNGHRIEVQERHRGRSGRCPQCKAPFLVPLAAPEAPKPEQTPEAETKPDEYANWVVDCDRHQVDPTKLKLKPGSLQTGGLPVDLWFHENELYLWQLVKPGLFGSGTDEKSREKAREKVREQLKEGTHISDVSVVHTWKLNLSEVAEEFTVVQPAPQAHASMFAGIPVFGDGRIGVRIPSDCKPPEQTFLALGLSQFRILSQQLAEIGGREQFGAAQGVPLEDEIANAACYFSEQLLKPLQHLEFYQADSSFELELIGWKCGACGLAVSEEARAKEKLGGAAGKSIAKAKCPKCQQKMENHPLYRLKADEASETSESEDDSEPAAEETAS